MNRYRRENLYLSAQLLSCCQFLFWEGRDILYGKNILLVRFVHRGVHMHLDYLSVSLEIPSHPLDLPDFTDLDLMTLVRPAQETSQHITGRKRFLHSRSKDICGLRQMRKIEVQMPSNMHQDAFIISYILQRTMQDKSITILAEQWYWDDPNRLILWLACFHRPKVHSITFEEVTLTDGRKPFKLGVNPGKEPDLLPATKELHRFLVQHRLHAREDNNTYQALTFSPVEVEEIDHAGLRSMNANRCNSELWTSVFWADVVTFSIVKRAILCKALQALDEAMKEYLDEVWDVYDIQGQIERASRARKWISAMLMNDVASSR